MEMPLGQTFSHSHSLPQLPKPSCAEKGDVHDFMLFREHLVDMGNRTVVDRYDEEGVSPGMVEALFKAFVLERLRK